LEMTKVSFITPDAPRSLAQDSYQQHEIFFDHSKQKQLVIKNWKSNFIFSNEQDHMYSDTTHNWDFDNKELNPFLE